MPKGDTPVPAVLPGAPDVPAANTRSFSVQPNGKVKPSQPLQLPADAKWGNQEVVVQAKPSAGSPIKDGWQKAMVTFVGDGDGAKLTTKGGERFDCRLDLIDAPETPKPQYRKNGQPFGEESKKSLQQMIENKEVTVKITRAASEKAQGRPICQIEIEGKDVSVEQLRKGMAWLYQRSTAGFDNRAIEDNNKAKGIGLFSDRSAQHPRDFKHGPNYSY